MALNLNKVIIAGTLGRDPEVRTFASGGQIATLNVATNESWKDRDTGEKKTRTEWHSVVIRGEGTVRFVEQYFRKGSGIYIEGTLQTRKWQDQSGNDRYSTEVVVAGADGKIKFTDSAGGSGQSSGKASSSRQEKSESFDDGLDDDYIPF